MQIEGYEFIDSGGGRRLERFGGVLCDRPAPVALWPRVAAACLWSEADIVYSREDNSWRGAPPADWRVSWGGNVFHLEPFGNAQLGIFPEQAANWEFIRAVLDGASAAGDINVLNCFAHTGGSTLAAARAGAAVCHVDAAGGANQRARQNALASGLGEAPVRWLTEDALKFMQREVRRGRRYEGIILDPPAFGRMGKDTWKLERDLPGLLELARGLLAQKPVFFLLSCHPPGWSARELAAFVRRHLDIGGREEHGELCVGAGGNALPLGYYYRLCFQR